MAPAPPNFSLRPAGGDDLEALFVIHREAMGEYIAATWGWNEEWQVGHFRNNFKTEVRSVIDIQGEPVGFIDIIERKDCIYLQNIEIAPRYQGRGIGTRIIRGLIARAEAKHVALKLQVLKVNPRARALYDRLGFRSVGETETHFQMEHEVRHTFS